MKNLLLILLFGISLNGQAQRSYPFLDEVIYKFFETYNLTDEKIEKGDKLDFLKKPEGWVIDIVYYNSEKEEMSVKKSMLFWDAESGNYQDLDFEVAGPRKEFLNYYSIYRAFLQTNPNDRLNFAIHSYYGYPSAYEDVLKAFSYSKDMNDTALYSLGDAYLNKMFPYNEVTHEKVEYSNNFVSDVSQGLQFKREVFKRNPNFQTVVGSIGIKYANDLVAVVYNSDVYFNHPENSNQYHDNAYPKWMIEYGKNILNHCPENAILFTTGDNDTYPLLYLQQHMHYREDVIVVNQSLIFTTEMIEYLIKKGIRTAIDIDAYKKEENQIIVLEPTTENTDIFNLLNGIQNGNLKTETYPNTDREFPVGQRAVYLQKEDKKMEWRINRARIFMGELAMLDIIASNFGDRPVCLMPGGSHWIRQLF